MLYNQCSHAFSTATLKVVEAAAGYALFTNKVDASSEVRKLDCCSSICASCVLNCFLQTIVNSSILVPTDLRTVGIVFKLSAIKATTLLVREIGIINDPLLLVEGSTTLARTRKSPSEPYQQLDCFTSC